MSAPIDLRPSKHVTWAFLLAEWVLACLFHELDVRCLQTQASLILRRPRSCPLYDGIAGHVLLDPTSRRRATSAGQLVVQVAKAQDVAKEVLG